MNIHIKKPPIILSLFILFAVSTVVFAVTRYSHEQKDGSLVSSTSSNGEVEIKHSSSIKSQLLTQKDTSDGFLLRLTSDNPPVLVSVRQEEGLSVLTLQTNKSLLSILTDNAIKSLATRYPDPEVKKQSEITVNSREASKIEFSYNSPTDNNEKIVQSLIIIPKADKSSALYISMQTTADNYNTGFQAVFDEMINSVKIN